MSVTLELAEYSLRARPAAGSIADARRAFEGAVRRAVPTSAAADAALAVAVAHGSPPQATLLGRPERLAVTWAAFVNGAAGEDAVVAAAMAMAEWSGQQLDAALAAVAVGSHSGRAVAAALAAAPGRRAWAADGVAALLGAAVAAGRLVGLDAQRQAMAIGIAATQVAGLARAAEHPGGRALLMARAAFDGVEAALLARAGFTAPTNGLEGRRGLAELTAPGADLSGLVRGIEQWN